MTTPLVVQFSRAFPVPVDRAFDYVLPAPLEDIFDQRFGPLPPIRSVEGPEGVWGTVGQARTIKLSDGGSMREELTDVDRPHRFGYRITELTGPLKPLAGSIDGSWRFDPVGTGVRITWEWTVHPASSVAELAMPLFGWLWKGYARQALEKIEALLLAS
ncbi:MAG: SRPBCC family protein [Actinomycetota bacterium]|nr:SRPBCC family protein [Actinomycetota bacterium]